MRSVSHLVRGFSYLLSSSFVVWRPSVGSAGLTVGEYFVLALFDLMNMAEMVSSEFVLASSPVGSPSSQSIRVLLLLDVSNQSPRLLVSAAALDIAAKSAKGVMTNLRKATINLLFLVRRSNSL